MAAVLVVGLVLGWLHHYSASTQRLAERYVRALGNVYMNQFKLKTLTLQRAALAESDVLPIYGTSEMYCCGEPYDGPAFYKNAPTGFTMFGVGHFVTRDLFWAETFGALGPALRGKRLVVSDSPWFFGPVADKDYDHTFSPEIAATFAFDAPLPMPLRGAIARRMLAYPETLQGQPLLTAALRDAARGGWRGDAAYWLLDPIGRISAWYQQVQDVRQTRELLWQISPPSLRPLVAEPGLLSWAPPQLRRRLALPGGQPPWKAYGSKPFTTRIDPNLPTKPQTIDWNAQLTAATKMAAQLTASNPFGVTQGSWKGCGDIQPVGGKDCQTALQMYQQGMTNHSGGVYSLPTTWVQGVETCTCYTDLDLEFEVLRAVQARPLAWVQPLQGALDDHTVYSAQARRAVYDRWLAIARAEGIPGTTFQTHDTDPLFVNSFGHLSQRGWVYADRLLDLFWHGQLTQVAPEMANGGSVDPLFPATLNCPNAQWCEGVDDVPALPGELSNLPVYLGLPPPAAHP